MGELVATLLAITKAENEGGRTEDLKLEVLHLVDMATRIKIATEDVVDTDDGLMTIDGVAVPKGLEQGIVKAVLSGKADVAEALRNFWAKLQKNPSESSRKNLFDFLSNNGMGINKEGDVVCYKFVNANMTDSYTGQTKITLGDEVTMEREDVLDDENIACGPGLHVGNKEYSYDRQSHVLITSFNPVDAVSCPTDHSYQKMRVCRYMPVALTHDADLTNHSVIQF